VVGTKASTDESESSSSMHSTPLLVIIEIFFLSRVWFVFFVKLNESEICGGILVAYRHLKGWFQSVGVVAMRGAVKDGIVSLGDSNLANGANASCCSFLFYSLLFYRNLLLVIKNFFFIKI
jgi:hypothetical protein